MTSVLTEPVVHASRSLSVHPLDTHAGVLDVIVRAFRHDPAVRWIFPDDQCYNEYFPEFVTAFGGAAFAHNTVDVAPELAGAALWLPAGTGPDEMAIGQVLMCALPESRQVDVFGMLDQAGAYHPPTPHWYLPLIGVDPAQQGRGVGSALLRHALARCDRDGLPAYLESTHPRNVPLYERHGFHVLGEIRVADSPPIFPMLRPGIRGN